MAMADNKLEHCLLHNWKLVEISDGDQPPVLRIIENALLTNDEIKKIAASSNQFSLESIQEFSDLNRLGILAVVLVCHSCSLHPRNQGGCLPQAQDNTITMRRPISRSTRTF